MTPRLKELYNKEIQPALKNQFGLKNIFMTPKIEKVVLNMGLGLDGADAKILKAAKRTWVKLLVKNLLLQNLKNLLQILKQEKDLMQA
jgi:large subunit ribosomal protein L5